MKYFKPYIVILFLLIACCADGQKYGFSFDSMFARHAELFDTVIDHKADYRLQILYTRIDRDENNVPHLTTYSYDADKYYYYCASMIKLPACVLTLEKLNNLAKYRLDMLDSLGIDSIGCTELTQSSMMLGSPYSCLGHYIKEMLMLSNNRAFNPVYDFLGQGYFQERLHELGLNSAVISNRFAGCDTIQNRISDPLALYDRHTHQLKYYQPSVTTTTRQFYNGDLDPKVGIGYIGYGNQLVHEPKDFRYMNYMALSDFHKLLTRVILPQTQTAQEKLHLTRRDYQYLYKCMGIFPRESAYPKLDSIHYPDNYMKYFMGFDTAVYTMPENIRIFNKVGQAYGFMTDCSYVMDTLNKVEFFLSCSMYLNADGILNDGVYEYDRIGFPFFHNLFNSIYDEELLRPKQHLAKLQLPDFSDTLLAKPGPPGWLKIDTTKSMAEIEAVLCRLADTMWRDRELVINYDNPTSDDIFYKNLSYVLRMPASGVYPFAELRKKYITIVSSDDRHMHVFSWDKKTINDSYVIFQFIDSAGRVRLRKAGEFKEATGPWNLVFTRIIQVKTTSGNIYLLQGKANDGAEHLQAYTWKDGKPEMVKAFEYNKTAYTELLIQKHSGKEHLTYDARHRIISFPIIIKSHKKVRTQLVKLKFDGHIFRQ